MVEWTEAEAKAECRDLRQRRDELEAEVLRLEESLQARWENLNVQDNIIDKLKEMVREAYQTGIQDGLSNAAGGFNTWEDSGYPEQIEKLKV